MNPNPEKNRRANREASENITRGSENPAKPARRRPNPRITPEAHAETILLQSVALRIGQEAARQNGIKTTPYLKLDGDPRGSQLATLEGVESETVSLRVTLTVDVNARTGAVVGFTPPPRPNHR